MRKRSSCRSGRPRVRRPVSTSRCEVACCRSVFGGVVGGVVLPAAPEYACPGAAEDADRVWVVAAACACSLVDVVGPGVPVAGAGRIQPVVATLTEREVAMGKPRRRAADRAGRPAMRSPGRPPAGRLEHRQRFWAAIARGLSSEDAALQAGVSAAVGVRWFPRGWRDAIGHAGPGVGALPVVRRA
jgi:hypothetical protein